MSALNIVTYNIHKGLSHFNRRIVLHELRERLRILDADIVFLQEVRGESDHYGKCNLDCRASSQYEFLADKIWLHQVYGKNSVYIGGHHGNAILSLYPILESGNKDVSAHRFENRGLLHCVIHLPEENKISGSQSLHCVCVHFGLFKRGRRMQFNALVDHIKKVIPADAPLIVAGDFNDWRNDANRLLTHELDLQEVFEVSTGKPARSFPAGMPLLRMDRIYVRGMLIKHSEAHVWRKISDHMALSAMLISP